MNKKKLIILISIIITLGILVCVGAFSMAGIKAAKIEEKLDLGEKYLEELEYEKALAIYDEILQIDPRNVDAYLGAAEVFLALGNYEKALEILEEGYEKTGAEEIEERIDEIKKVKKVLYPELSRFISEYLHHYPSNSYFREDVDYEKLLKFAYSYMYYNDPYRIYKKDGFDGECIAAVDVNDCVREFFGVEIPLKNHGAVKYQEDAFCYIKEYFTNGGNYLAVIKDAVRVDDTYYVTFQDVYVRWDGNENSSLEDYYSQDYDDVKDDKFCDVYEEGTCVFEKNDDEWTIVRLTLNRDEKAVAESRAGILEWNGHYYAIYDNVLSWSEAVAFCESQGGHMATIASQEENDALFAFIKEMGYESVYFGYCDDIEEDNWYWIGEEDNTYSNWHLPGEPNNEGGREDYGMFYYKYPDGTWNDGDFGGITVRSGTVYICEWDSKRQMKAE